MPLLDFLLNLVGALLWLNWRSARFDPLARLTPASLVGTLRPAKAPRWRGWQFPAALVGLLALRAVVYWQIGPEVDWTPRLDLGVISLPFRVLPFWSGFLYSGLLYSLLSFARMMLIIYFWLLILAMINRHRVEPDPLLKLIRLHLGRVARWPWALQAGLAPVVAAIGWLGLHPLLVRGGIISPVPTLLHLVGQGCLLGVSLCFTLKYLLPLFLLLYLVASYVYLGNNPFWDFIGGTSRCLLAPLRLLPLRLAKLDFAPLVGAFCLLLLLHVLPNYLLPWMLKKNLALSLWPQ